MIDELRDLPSVHEEQRTGHWIVSKWQGDEMLTCDQCRNRIYADEDHNYCANCGAKMESEEQA